MKGSFMKKLFLCSVLFLSTQNFGFNRTVLVAQAAGLNHGSVLDTKYTDSALDGLTLSDSAVQEKALRIIKEAHVLFESAKNLFDKLLRGSYARDKLTFKDFVWGLKGLTEGMNNRIIGPLKALRSDVKNDQSMSTALSIVESIAVELHQGTAALCNVLHPYERTKNTRDAYKIAKIIKTNTEQFLNKDRFEKFKKRVDEVILIVSQKSGYNRLASELKELKNILDQLNLGSSQAEEAKVLRIIINRIKKN